MNDQTSTPTNDPTDPWETEMASEFDRRVRDLHESPFTFDTVHGRAVSIRRRRRAAVAGGIIAAAAVVVPVAVLAIDPDSGTDPGIPAATRTTATDTPTPAPPPVDLAPVYLEGATLHLADGSAVELPKDTYEAAGAMGDRVVAASRDEGNVTIDVIEGGEVVDTMPSASDLVLNLSGDVAAFVTPQGAVQTIWADGEAVLAEGYQGWSVRAVDGGPDCLDPEAGGSGCVVALIDQSGQGGEPTLVDSHGIEDVPIPGAYDIKDVQDGRLAVVPELDYADPEAACSEIYDTASAASTLEDCDHTLVQFSPEGSHVLAFPGQYDGFGPGLVAILDATTGDELASVRVAEDFQPSKASWVDDDTIAVTVFNAVEQTWSLLTLSAGDAEPQVVAGPAPGSDFEPAFIVMGR